MRTLFTQCWASLIFLKVTAEQRHIQNPVEHLRKNVLRKYLTARKKLHLKCSIGFWILLSIVLANPVRYSTATYRQPARFFWMQKSFQWVRNRSYFERSWELALPFLHSNLHFTPNLLNITQAIQRGLLKLLLITLEMENHQLFTLDWKI